MFESFVLSDWFYVCFGLSYVVLVAMIYSYLKDLGKLSDKVDELQERLDKAIKDKR